MANVEANSNEVLIYVNNNDNNIFENVAVINAIKSSPQAFVIQTVYNDDGAVAGMLIIINYNFYFIFIVLYVFICLNL